MCCHILKKGLWTFFILLLDIKYELFNLNLWRLKIIRWQVPCLPVFNYIHKAQPYYVNLKLIYIMGLGHLVTK